MAYEFRCGLYFELLLFLLNLQVFVVDLFAALAGTISGMTNMHYQPNLTQSVLQAFKRKVSMYRLACFTRPFHGFFLSFDWDQLVKICQHDWKEHLKPVNLPSVKAIC